MGPRTIFEEYAMCPFVLRNNLHSNIVMISYTKSYGLLLVALPTKSGYLKVYLSQLFFGPKSTKSAKKVAA